MTNVCWYFFKLALGLALVAAAVIGVYLYARMDDEIRRHVERLLSDRYPQLSVSVAGARLVQGKGIAVYEVTIGDPGGARGAAPLLAIDELLLVCDVNLPSLIEGRPQVRRVEVRRPQLALRRAPSLRWNYEPLLEDLRPMGTAFPPVVIRGGVITVEDEAAPDRPLLALRDVDVAITPVADPVAEVAETAPGARWPSLRVEATGAGPQVKRIDVQATLDGPGRVLTGAVDVDQLQVDEGLLVWAREHMPAAAAATRVAATVDGKVTMTWNMRSGSPPQYAAALTVSGGRIDDPRLPRPVTDVVGSAAFDSQQLKLQELRGRWGAATVAISMNRTGWSADAPIALSARATGLPLDDDLYRALAVAGNPQSTHAIRIANVLREQWDKYRPEGIVDAELQATFDGRTWRPQATLAGRELSFASEKFAYRLTHGDGTIRFRSANADGPAVLDVNLGGLGAGQRVSIVAQVIDPRPGAAGWVQITGDDLVIDDHLIAAVDQRIEEASHRTAQSVIASLHPAGRFNLVYWRLERPHPGAEPQSSMRLDMTDVRINYDGFPYPLQKIRGVIQAQGDHWTFANFASGGRRTILAHGHLLPTEAGSHELWLHFTGQNIPLGDDSLYWALQEPVRDAWKKLQPTGAINVTADVRHRFGQARPQVSVVIEPLANCTLKPQFFSYLMEDVTGTITYTDGAVNLQNMKARHQDGVTMGANGAGTFTADRGWEFTLSGLWADGVKVRPALMTALPEKLRRLVDTLRPSGSFSLHGSELSFRQPASALAPLEARWDLQLECHQSDIHCGIDVESVSGSVRLQGIANQQQSYSAGELTLETLTYQDVQFTDVTGPMWVDESQCRFGKWATEQTGQPERRLKGRVYDGAMSSNAWVSFGHRPQYGVEAALVGADLNRLIVERFSGQQPYQGKIDATLVLSGEGPLLARLTGEGDVHIREANIYELPLLMSLLKVLRTGAPDKTAFNQSDIAFRIQGPHIYLDTINFLGDVVDLYGYGETGFDQHLKLFFRSELGPREYLLPAVKELVGQASQRIMQLYVDGTLSEPRVTTEAFPQINQMVKQIRNDLENPPPTPGGLQAQRTDVFGRPASR